MNSVGLYVHIPFCAVKCRFCDFAVFPGLQKEIPRYLSALEREMQFYSGTPVRTVFFGGGTPSLLSVEDWQKLFAALRKNFSWSDSAEISIECNPESVTPEKLNLWQSQKVSRLSLGLQASQEKHLARLGRQHRWETFLNAFQMARTAGFKNLNVDLMFGLPEQTLAEWRQTLEAVAALQPEHVSCYALTIEEHTAFQKSGVTTDEELSADFFETAADFLNEQGYEQYEISNYAKNGFACEHNLLYWRNQPTLGLGVAAASFIDGSRQKNHARFLDYVEALENNRQPIAEKYRLEEAEQAGEDLMLALRLKEGATLNKQTRQWYGSALRKFTEEKLLQIEGDRARLTRSGWLVSNALFQELLGPENCNQL